MSAFSSDDKASSVKLSVFTDGVHETINGNSYSYFAKHAECLENYYSSENPNGGISLCIAENKLCGEVLLKKMRAFDQMRGATLCYDMPYGSLPLRTSLARFLSNRIFNRHEVRPDQLICSAGVTALLYQLSLTLFNPGDALLLPIPFYPVFKKDFTTLNKVHIQEVHGSGDHFSFTIPDLETAYQDAILKGHPPKALMLCNPHNPLGTVLSPSFLMEIITWCRGKHLHVIADEIYALSTFAKTSLHEKDGDDDSSKGFVSVVEVLKGQLLDDIHVLWGLSKDISASGLRVGVLYSQNAKLLTALTFLSDPYQGAVYFLSPSFYMTTVHEHCNHVFFFQ